MIPNCSPETPQCLSFSGPYSVMKIAGHWPTFGD
jgi:hypothetical protein